MVLGATNRPQDLDEAALRRFSRRIMVDLPDKAARKAILKVCPTLSLHSKLVSSHSVLHKSLVVVKVTA
jgi:SpoVK/Ycf46/Vps4 family AAA+-type ATPase